MTIQTALTEAAAKLSSLKLSTVYGEANHDDAKALADDIEVVGQIVLSLLNEMADYAQGHTGADIGPFYGLSDDIADTVGALSKRAEEMREEESGRASRSYMRAQFQGVD